jgi:hypothetical protein
MEGLCLLFAASDKNYAPQSPARATFTTKKMSAFTASPAVFARKALAGKAVAPKQRTAVKARAAFSVSANAKVDACDKNSVIVSPSILSANFATLGAEVREIFCCAFPQSCSLCTNKITRLPSHRLRHPPSPARVEVFPRARACAPPPPPIGRNKKKQSPHPHPTPVGSG